MFGHHYFKPLFFYYNVNVIMFFFKLCILKCPVYSKELQRSIAQQSAKLENKTEELRKQSTEAQRREFNTKQKT